MNGISALQWHRMMIGEYRGSVLTGVEVLKRLPRYAAITDAKSVYDAIARHANVCSHTSDKRTAIDLAIIKEFLAENGSMRWVDTKYQLADSLTKAMKPELLRKVMQCGRFGIMAEEDGLAAKKTNRENDELRRAQKFQTADETGHSRR